MPGLPVMGTFVVLGGCLLVLLISGGSRLKKRGGK
jgi:hypothetical protein